MKFFKNIFSRDLKKNPIDSYNEYLEIVKKSTLINNYLINNLSEEEIDKLLNLYPFLSDEAKKIIENTIFNINLTN